MAEGVVGESNLIYPITSDLEGKVIEVAARNTDILDIQTLFPRLVLIERFEKGVAHPDIWNKLQLSYDLGHEMRLILDDFGNCMKVLVTYNSVEEARAAVSKYHHTQEHPDICAIIVEDLLNKIRAMEERIAVDSCIKDQEQLVLFSNFTAQPDELNFIELLTEAFSSVSCKFSVFVINLNEGQAMLKFPTFSKAFASELAFNQTRYFENAMFVRTNQNPVYVQHDLQTRLSLIGREEEDHLLKQKPSSKNVDKVRPVVCSNLNCQGCCKDPANEYITEASDSLAESIPEELEGELLSMTEQSDSQSESIPEELEGRLLSMTEQSDSQSESIPEELEGQLSSITEQSESVSEPIPDEMVSEVQSISVQYGSPIESMYQDSDGEADLDESVDQVESVPRESHGTRATRRPTGSRGPRRPRRSRGNETRAAWNPYF